MQSDLGSSSTDVSIILLQAGRNVTHLELALSLFIRQSEQRVRTGRGPRVEDCRTSGQPYLHRQVSSLNGAGAIQDGTSFNHVSQLANVAWPGMFRKPLERFG